jgi:hypothetical protein
MHLMKKKKPNKLVLSLYGKKINISHYVISTSYSSLSSKTFSEGEATTANHYPSFLSATQKCSCSEPVIHTCNASYSGSRDQEDHG